MFFGIGGGSWARNDMQDYRNHYPNNKDDTTADLNLRFYKNEIPLRPENKTIEEVLDEWYGAHRFLEYCHSYIQWLFPIQEQGLNYAAQPAQKWEFAAMKNDPKVMERVKASFELMLDFYGFKFENGPCSVAAARYENYCAAPEPEKKTEANKKNDDDASQKDDAPPKRTASSSSATDDQAQPSAPLPSASDNVKIVRSDDFEERFDNLNTSSHNYLRITRMCKFLGELGLENYKIAWLKAFETELFTDKLLMNCVDSFQNYWIGTIYDDDVRADFEKRAADGLETVRAAKKAAWEARWGASSYGVQTSTATTATAVDDAPATVPEESTTSNNNQKNQEGGDDDAGPADAASSSSAQQRNENNNGAAAAVNFGGVAREPEQHVFRLNSSDLETTPADSRQNSNIDGDDASRVSAPGDDAEAK